MWKESLCRKMSLCICAVLEPSHTQYMELEGASDKESYRWPYWAAGHMCLKDHEDHNTKIPFLMERVSCEPHHENPVFGGFSTR